MPIDRRLYNDLRQLDRYDLRRVAIFVHGLLLQLGDDFTALGDAGAGAGPRVTYRLETVRCGKQSCRSCPHGPYWYAYWREGGRLRSRYVGRELPEGVRPLEPDDAG